MAFAISQTAQPRLALPQGTTTAPPAGATTAINPRTRLLLEGPIAATLLRASRSSQRCRPAQAAISHDHSCLHHKKWAADDELWRDGRLHAGPGAHANHDPVRGLSSESAGRLRRDALAC